MNETTDMTEVESDLLERLNSPDVSADDVYDYLKYMGVESQEARDFFAGQTDIEHYKAAMNWWPRHADLPRVCEPPTLQQLCFGVRNKCETFLGRLTARAQKAQDWAEGKVKPRGRPRVRETLPGETDDERRRRLNREAVARHRQRSGATVPAERLVAVAEAYAAYRQACADRKAAEKRVLETRLAWMQLKNNPPA